jgi:membrane-associated protein
MTLAELNLIDMFLHLDQTLEKVIQQYHTWIYLIIFAVIFCETGLVITPFLPGDSLLFAAGSLAALPNSELEIKFMYPLLCLAAACGDNTNYWVGRFLGPKVFRWEDSLLFKREYLDRTHRFYERHGGKTVAFARFMPIFRTFVPFVAGIGKMTYWRFITFSIIGTFAWASTFVLGGFFFGNIPWVKGNFTIVIMIIVTISFMPAFIAYLKNRKSKKANS